MDKKFAFIIALGALIGAVFGVSFTPVVQNDLLAIVGGALAGVFIGWFSAAALRQKSARQPLQSEKRDER
jgi:NhaP-type Na+/H+ or K+/H+ antiporter